jgi:antitoxin HigA-1
MATRSAHGPIHPGEILREEFLVPLGVSANSLANQLGIPVNRLTEIIRGRRGITGETAILLGRVFQTTPEFWLNLQSHYELEVAEAQISKDRLRRAERIGKTFRAA